MTEACDQILQIFQINRQVRRNSQGQVPEISDKALLEAAETKAMVEHFDVKRSVVLTLYG